MIALEEPMSRETSTGWAARAAACLMLALCAAAVPGVARAAGPASRTGVIGTGGAPYSLTKPVSDGVAVVPAVTGQQLTIRTVERASFGASSDAYRNFGITHPDPRGVEAMADGNVLVADAANHRVLWMTSVGGLVWSYASADDPSLQAPVCVRKVTNSSFLIVDRDADRVFIVGLNDTVQWQYGTTGVAGSGVDQLDAPTYADILPNGDIAICDAGNNRVIVVRRDDSSIVWQYGTTGSPGSGVDQLVRPTSVQWLTAGTDAGNALICDQGAGRVVEIRASDYDQGFSAGSVVWEYPVGGGSGQPACAAGLDGADQIVWISDSSSGHVYAVATGSAVGAPTGHEIVADFVSGAPAFRGSLVAPVALSLADDGSVLVADPGAARAVLLGTPDKLAYPQSTALNCGWTGRKRFTSITVSYLDIPTTTLALRYQVDGLGWNAPLMPPMSGSPGGIGGVKTVTYPLPPKTAGTTITYELDMSQGSKALAPRVMSLAITCQSTGPASGSGGGGEGGNNKNANGSGTYSYPGSGGGSGQGSGGGTGGGTGSGSGSGTGTGYGSGSSGSTTGTTDLGTPMAGSPTGQELPSVVDPAAATAPGSDAEVSGYLMKASGYAGGGEGGGSSPKQAVTAGGWMLLPAGMGLFCLGLFAVAAASENRRIRAYADFDAGRARALPAEVTPTTRPPLPPPIVKPAGRR